MSDNVPVGVIDNWRSLGVTGRVDVTAINSLAYFLDGVPVTGSGGGTVTNVSVVDNDGITGVVLNPTTTPSITLFLGDITPTGVSATGNITTTGTISTTGTVSAGKLITAAGNAPSSPTVAGTTGTIAWSPTHIYVCVAPNTWVRAALATW